MTFVKKKSHILRLRRLVTMAYKNIGNLFENDKYMYIDPYMLYSPNI